MQLYRKWLYVIFLWTQFNFNVSKFSVKLNLNRVQLRILTSIAFTQLSLIGTVRNFDNSAINLLQINKVYAANLPESTGASGRLQGTLEALRPINSFYTSITKAIESLEQNNDVAKIKLIIYSAIPTTEKEFKRVFDEYSFSVSYKQQYLDKNAFLVYYTKGFDGPNRQSIEETSNTEFIQTQQYGYRNDAWVSLKDSLDEIDYLIDSKSTDLSDLKKSLINCKDAIKSYISLAPADQQKAL